MKNKILSHYSKRIIHWNNKLKDEEKILDCYNPSYEGDKEAIEFWKERISAAKKIIKELKEQREYIEENL